MVTEFHQFLSPQWITPKNISFGVSEYTLRDPLSRGLLYSHTSNFAGRQTDNLDLLQDSNPLVRLEALWLCPWWDSDPQPRPKFTLGIPVVACSSLGYLSPNWNHCWVSFWPRVTENLMTSRSLFMFELHGKVDVVRHLHIGSPRERNKCYYWSTQWFSSCCVISQSILRSNAWCITFLNVMRCVAVPVF